MEDSEGMTWPSTPPPPQMAVPRWAGLDNAAVTRLDNRALVEYFEKLVRTGGPATQCVFAVGVQSNNCQLAGIP